jgi:hypothetical protein
VATGLLIRFPDDFAQLGAINNILSHVDLLKRVMLSEAKHLASAAGFFAALRMTDLPPRRTR